MRKVKLIFVLTILLVLFQGVISFGQNAVKQPIVKIIGTNEYGQEDEGSGVIVGSADSEVFIITAAHVIPQPDKIKVAFFESSIVSAQVVRLNNNLDFAVIKCKKPNDFKFKSSFAIAKSEEKPLQSVIVIGHPKGNYWDINFNTNIKTIEHDLDDRLFTLAPIGITPGNSGGPVLNQKYELLGLVQNVDQVKAVCIDLPTIMKACGAWKVPTNLLTGINLEEKKAEAGEEDFRYKLFLQEANTAFAAKKWAIAKDAFNEVYTLSPDAKIQSKIMQCELEIEKDKLYKSYFLQGKQASTLESSIGFFEKARVQRDTKEVRKRIKFARERLAKLEIQQTEIVSRTNLKEKITDVFAGEMILVRGGTFLMGNDEDDFSDDEFPLHRVLLSDYYIGANEVTVGQFCTYLNALVEKNPLADIGFSEHDYIDKIKISRTYNNNPVVSFKYRAWNNTDEYPMNSISWEEANAYCLWLSQQEGYIYRLPSEAEWEYAASGGHKGKKTKYSGSDDIEKLINLMSSRRKLHEVGSKLSNEIGIFDMTGNVWEFCNDWYKENYYSICNEQGVISNPIGPNDGQEKVMRGGSNYRIYDIKNRKKMKPTYRDADAGFRVVKLPYERYKKDSQKGFLGVFVKEITETEAVSLGMSSSFGLFVEELVKNAPAEKGGIQIGDIILEIEGETINEVSSFQKTMTNFSPNDRIDIKILRGGQQKVISVFLISVSDFKK